MIYIRDLIKKKRNKYSLSKEEIRFFIFSYYKGEILDEQAAALWMLMNINGLSYNEMAYMAQAISETGEIYELYKISQEFIDIHPVGGLDDKVIIILNAIMSSLGVPVLRTVGREIGILDKIPNIELLDIKTDKNLIKTNILENKMLFLKEPKDMAPIENKLYKLRNDIACNNDPFLIAINLISQKLSLGIKNTVFDISYGKNAYIKTFKDAKKLCKILIKIGQRLDINVKCIITKLYEPIGYSFGNIVETQEILQFLNKNANNDLQNMVMAMGNLVLKLSKKYSNNTFKQNKELIEKTILDSDILKKNSKILAKGIDEINLKTIHKIPILCNVDGYIKEIDVAKMRMNATFLNAIRHDINNNIDLGAGMEFNKKIGDKVRKGEILGYIYTNDETKIYKAVENYKELFLIMPNEKVKPFNRIAKYIIE